ncbi:MAG: methylcrotonoyl-CoA carboxylase [Marinilabiliales bacterium]|nr:MAG: methylcrotonoyl-CoA carboxylase [Marinilabiliales bacterium]
MKLFNRILIANRGEIAVRIIKSARKLGIKTVAIFSKADEDALHVRMADESVFLDEGDTPGNLSETYLNVDKIINAALQTKADAIHPGYGFLSESPLLVDACEKNNISFIGPNVKSIELMGNKIEARAFVKSLGIPMTEGINGSPDELLKNAHKIKLPILVKAAAGGGGKGMRIVNENDDLKQVLETTSREAKNYFGDGSIYIEKYVVEPRHIEFQVLGDNHGNVIHLFDRECSIQRRYQKIIEESPSVTLTDEVRSKMGEDAVKIAKAVGYNSAGTIEFLVDKDLNYYFLEMNTRIQVEHPVTEMVTGVDLVEEQIKIAAGNKLEIQQSELSQKGHAIECRIYAEDPANNFMPSPGNMTFYKQSEGENIRVDSGIDKAGTIHSFFDPMISKQVVWAVDRESAIKNSIDALNNYIVHGIKTNIPYLQQMLMHQSFAKNNISTKFCDTHNDELLNNATEQKLKINGIPHLIAFAVHSLNMPVNKNNIWEQIGYWRTNSILNFKIEDEERSLNFISKENESYKFSEGETIYEITLVDVNENFIKFSLENRIIESFISEDGNGISTVSALGKDFSIERTDILNNKRIYSSAGGENSEGNLCSPMPGKVIQVNVKEGEEVSRGKVLLVVEAMKMENNITAMEDAVVEKISVKEGDMVEGNAQLVFLTSK